MNVKVNDRIRMVSMPDDPCPIPTGTLGTVISVTRYSSAGAPDTQLGVRWDNGRTLSVIIPPDVIDVLDSDVAADQSA